MSEDGSALNGHPKRLLGLLGDPQVRTVVVEHRGRLARFGPEQVQAVLSVSGPRLLVVDPTQEDGDRAGDVKETSAWHVILSWTET